MALQRLAGFKQREGFRGVDAERFEHLRGQHLADATLERQAPIAEARIGRLARALGAEIQQAVLIVAQLRVEKAAPVADLRIVHAELMAMITHRQRLRLVVRQGFEAREMAFPRAFAERAEPHTLGPLLIAPA
jgi:hypothetical protein